MFHVYGVYGGEDAYDAFGYDSDNMLYIRLTLASVLYWFTCTCINASMEQSVALASLGYSLALCVVQLNAIDLRISFLLVSLRANSFLNARCNAFLDVC
jgi:hypothetical protein